MALFFRVLLLAIMARKAIQIPEDSEVKSKNVPATVTKSFNVDTVLPGFANKMARISAQLNEGAKRLYFGDGRRVKIPIPEDDIPPPLPPKTKIRGSSIVPGDDTHANPFLDQTVTVATPTTFWNPSSVTVTTSSTITSPSTVVWRTPARSYNPGTVITTSVTTTPTVVWKTPARSFKPVTVTTATASTTTTTVWMTTSTVASTSVTTSVVSATPSRYVPTIPQPRGSLLVTSTPKPSEKDDDFEDIDDDDEDEDGLDSNFFANLASFLSNFAHSVEGALAISVLLIELGNLVLYLVVQVYGKRVKLSPRTIRTLHHIIRVARVILKKQAANEPDQERGENPSNQAGGQAAAPGQQRDEGASDNVVDQAAAAGQSVEDIARAARAESSGATLFEFLQELKIQDKVPFILL